MGWYSRSKQGEAEWVRVYHPYPKRFDRMVKEGGLEVRALSEILPPDVDAEE
jgi:hypothetical protein